MFSRRALRNASWYASRDTSSRKPGCKGQFTILALLGIVMVIAFAFALYARSVTIKAQLQQEASTMLSKTLDTVPITLYVTRCLDEATKDAMTLAALQGGVIYDTQGGMTHLDPDDEGTKWLRLNVPEYATEIGSGRDSEKYSEVYVPYWVRQQTNKICVDKSLPRYPYEKQFAGSWSSKFISSKNAITDCEKFVENYQGSYFGNLSMPRLCTSAGPNSKSFSGSTCKAGLYGSNNTVQQQLETMISNKMKTCVNFALFEDTFGNNISVENNPSVNVTFSQKAAYISAQYPFTVMIRGKVPVVKMVSFQTSSDIPFKETYTFLSTLMSWDVESFDFLPLKQYTKVGNDYAILPHPADTYLYKTLDVCPTCIGQSNGEYADILTLVDNKTIINGKPLIFNLAIQNRWPALDYIHETPVGQTIDIVRMEGDVIELRPYGYDPDDGMLKYIYGGWKETENAYFDYDECHIDPDCPLDPALFVKEIPLEDTDTKWSESSLFQTTKQFASYTTNASDVGMHTVTIKVQKEGGFTDSQPVSIFIFDLPKAVPRGKSVYADIPDNWASIEDPYILDASLSTASIFGVGVTSMFFWNDTLSDNAATNLMYIATSDPVVNVLQEGWGDLNHAGVPLDIRTIRDFFNFTKPRFGVDNDQFIQHNITLAVEETLSDGTIVRSDKNGILPIFSVNVSQCVPHHNYDGNGIIEDSWPYVIFTDEDSSIMAMPGGKDYIDDDAQLIDPSVLQGDHTCCNDAPGSAYGTYRDTTTECRTEVIYGSVNAIRRLSKTDGFMARYDFDYNNQLWWAGRLPTPMSYQEQKDQWKVDMSGKDPMSDSQYLNDIFSREFKRYCSGDRGNICNGPVEEKWYVYESCKDNGNNQDQALRVCSGPAVSSDPAEDHVHTAETMADPATQGVSPPHCYNYGPRQNFAVSYLGSDAPEFDNNAPAIDQSGLVIQGVPTYCADSYAKSTVHYDFSPDGYGSTQFGPNPGVTSNIECRGYCDRLGECKATIPEDCMCTISNACKDLPNVKEIYDHTSEGGICVSKEAGQSKYKYVNSMTTTSAKAWCNLNCEQDTEEDKNPEACNCINQHSKLDMFCGELNPDTGSEVTTNCWVYGSDTSNIGAGCCEYGTTDTFLGEAWYGRYTGCVNGQYYDDPDEEQRLCEWAKGTDHWFGQGQCCDKPTDIYANDASNSQYCCARGTIIDADGVPLYQNRDMMCKPSASKLIYCVAPGSAPPVFNVNANVIVVAAALSSAKGTCTTNSLGDIYKCTYSPARWVSATGNDCLGYV